MPAESHSDDLTKKSIHVFDDEASKPEKKNSITRMAEKDAKDCLILKVTREEPHDSEKMVEQKQNLRVNKDLGSKSLPENLPNLGETCGKSHSSASWPGMQEILQEIQKFDIVPPRKEEGTLPGKEIDKK